MKTQKKIKAWAVIDKKTNDFSHVVGFGDRNRVKIFLTKKEAQRENRWRWWKVVPCEIIIKKTK